MRRFEVFFCSVLIAGLASACGAARSAADVAGAVSDYTRADREWDDYENKKTAETRAAYEAGLQMHGEYMAMKAPADAGPDVAPAWYARQSKLLGLIDERFRAVHHSTFYEKIMIAESRLAEGWEKLAVELKAMHGADLAAHPEADSLKAEMNQTLLNAATYYQRVATDYADYPEVVKANAELVALAEQKAAALEAERQAYLP